MLSILRDHSANISFIVVIPRVARHDYFNSDLISLHRSAAAKDKLMRSHFREESEIILSLYLRQYSLRHPRLFSAFRRCVLACLY